MDECKGDKKQMKVNDALYKGRDLRACPEFTKKEVRGEWKRCTLHSIFQPHKTFKSLLKSVNAVYM